MPFGFGAKRSHAFLIFAPFSPGLCLAKWRRGFLRQRVEQLSVEAVTAYLSDQAEHHRKFSSQEELGELLKRHRVAFDERYVWE